MARKPRPPIERVGTEFRINLDIEERELVHRLTVELRQLLTQSLDDERLRRLFPIAYHQNGDRELEEEYQRLMREELLESRLKGLDTVNAFMSAKNADKQRLTEAQLAAFLQAVNSVRLVLGTMLDVSEEHDFGEVADDDPYVGEYHLYDFLSWILDWTVRALQS